MAPGMWILNGICKVKVRQLTRELSAGSVMRYLYVLGPG
jgi:hypothetical protein